jgi:hypothetical protein
MGYTKKALTPLALIVPISLVLIVAVNGSSQGSGRKVVTDEEAGRRFMDDLNASVASICHSRTLKEWKYTTNMTRENKIMAVSEIPQIN